MKRILVIFFLVIFLILSISSLRSYLFKPKENPNFKIIKIENKKIININELVLYVDIAKTQQEKAKGLSGRNGLKDNEGMLFLFEKKQIPSFWMKGMLFPIDIIWISDNLVVDIDKDIPNPNSKVDEKDLILYSPNEPVNYVLEVKAGLSDRYNIKVGDKVDLSSIN